MIDRPVHLMRHKNAMARHATKLKRAEFLLYRVSLVLEYPNANDAVSLRQDIKDFLNEKRSRGGRKLGDSVPGVHAT